MLRGRAEDRLETLGLPAEPPHDGRELDRFGAGADDEQDALAGRGGRFTRAV